MDIKIVYSKVGRSKWDELSHMIKGTYSPLQEPKLRLALALLQQRAILKYQQTIN